MHQKMKMECMSKMMQKDNPSGMSMPEKGSMSKDQKHHGMDKAEGNKGIVFKAE